jgi:hypothetical protein
MAGARRRKELSAGPQITIRPGSRKKSPAISRAKLSSRRKLPGLLAIPVVNVLLDLILGEAITLLDLTFELIPATVDGGEVIVGELAPLLLDLACDLLPVSFNTIPVHGLTSIAMRAVTALRP